MPANNIGQREPAQKLAKNSTRGKRVSHMQEPAVSSELQAWKSDSEEDKKKSKAEPVGVCAPFATHDDQEQEIERTASVRRQKPSSSNEMTRQPVTTPPPCGTTGPTKGAPQKAAAPTNHLERAGRTPSRWSRCARCHRVGVASKDHLRGREGAKVLRRSKSSKQGRSVSTLTRHRRVQNPFRHVDLSTDLR